MRILIIYVIRVRVRVRVRVSILIIYGIHHLGYIIHYIRILHYINYIVSHEYETNEGFRAVINHDFIDLQTKGGGKGTEGLRFYRGIGGKDANKPMPQLSIPGVAC